MERAEHVVVLHLREEDELVGESLPVVRVPTPASRYDSYRVFPLVMAGACTPALAGR